VRDVRIATLAGAQFNRVSRAQLAELGLGDNAIAHRVAAGRLVIVEQGVFALPPVLEHDDWGRWMGATLTAPDTRLSIKARRRLGGSGRSSSAGLRR
jgi:hypothetical protein